MAMSARPILIVGCGPGSPAYVTPAARYAARHAEVLVGAKRLLELFEECEGERIAVGADIEGVLDEIAARVERGRRVAVLVTGDPGLCSLAGPVLRRFGPERCEVVPGISSVQVAFARVGLDWLDAKIISTHKALPQVEPSALAGATKIAILAGRPESLGWAADLAEGLGTGWRAVLCENLTLDDERIRRLAPEELRSAHASSRSIILLIREADLP